MNKPNHHCCSSKCKRNPHLCGNNANAHLKIECQSQTQDSFMPGGGTSSTNNNNNNNANGSSQNKDGDQLLRNMILNGCSKPPPKSVEREVDRLMDCARCYCEKEKIKLKQFYEDELLKKKKVIISEFRCAMEREVIAPLKRKLCEYEREIYRLQEEHQNNTGSGRKEGGTDLDKAASSNAHHQEEVLQAELDKALHEKAELEALINREKERRGGSAFNGTGIKAQSSEADRQAPSRAYDLSDPTLTPETKALLQEIHELTLTLEESKKFAKDEIQDLIQEGEIMMECQKKAIEMERENDQMKKIIEDLMFQVNGKLPPKGSIESDNLTLRKRVSELEGTRTKSSLEIELIQARRELQAMQKLKDEAETKAREKSQNKEGMLEQKFVEGTEDQMDETTQTKMQRRRSSLKSGKSNHGTATAGNRVSFDNASRKGSTSSVKRKASKSGSTKSLSESEKMKKKEEEECPRCDLVAAPYEAKIVDLNERIKELEGTLLTFNELEKKVNELQGELGKIDLLNSKISEQMEELETLRNIEPVVCPPPSYTELNKLKETHAETERNYNNLQEKLHKVSKDAEDMHHKSQVLIKEVEELKEYKEKAAKFEKENTELLKEKKSFGEKVLQLEAENSDLTKSLEEIGDKFKSVQSKLDETKKAKDRLSKEVDELRIELENENKLVQELQRDMQEKEKQVKGLSSKIESLQKEIEGLKKELQEWKGKYEVEKKARENFEKEFSSAKKTIEELKAKLAETEKALKDLRKKCDEECSALSKRGECILQHEEKSFALATQMEEDNVAIRTRLRLLEEQLEAMADMESKTRNLHKEMAELQERAQGRTKTLGELKNIKDVCNLKNMEFGTCPVINAEDSVIYLPTPSDENASASGRSTSSGKEKIMGMEFIEDGQQQSSSTIIITEVVEEEIVLLEEIEMPTSTTTAAELESSPLTESTESNHFILLARKIEELEEEKAQLDAEFEGKVKAVEELNKRLSIVIEETEKLAEEEKDGVHSKDSDSNSE